MVMSIQCCYQCKDRAIGCHSTCERYREAKAVHEKDKQLSRESMNPIIHCGDFFGDGGLRRGRVNGRRKRK